MDFPLDAPLHALACDRLPPEAEALTFVSAQGQVERHTFRAIAEASKSLAEVLAQAGVGPRTPVAVVAGQCPLVPVVHLALSRLGAVAVPLSPLFGVDGLQPRLALANPALAFVAAEKEAEVRAAAPDLPLAVLPAEGLALPPLPAARAVPTVPEVPGESPPLAVVFTSGTTAQPKGAVLPHRILPGRMAGFLQAHPGFPLRGDRFWSPADWAWIGGLYDALFAPWACGAPVFAYARTGPFDPAKAGSLLLQHHVRNAFLPPTALRKWMRAGVPGLPLRTLHTAGEPLPAPVHAWAAKAFHTPPREVYGLTECAFLLVNGVGRAGVTGKPAPGHALMVVREDGAPSKAGEVGELTVKRTSPTMMLGYLRDGALELPLDAHGWFHSGDLARRNHDGAWTIEGRADDVVKVSGHRVSPKEVEAVLLAHPLVEECAVVGVPDEVRGHALRAVVVAPAKQGLAEELQGWVRTRLAPHLVPREVVVAQELPRTTSGKVRRKDLRA